MTTKCEYCENSSTRHRGGPGNGRDLCEIHYAEEDSGRYRKAKQKIGMAPEEVPKCELCGTRSLNARGTGPRLISHHVCYGHDTTVDICDSCHQAVHNDPEHKLQPHDNKLLRGTAEHNDYPEDCEYADILEADP